MISEAIDHYHDLLTSSIGEDSWARLDGELRARRLNFGERRICSVLRPYFLTPDESKTIHDAGQLVLSALHKTVATVDRRDYEPLLGLTAAEADLTEIDCGFTPPETIARLDGFWMRDGRLGFVEFNAESPGGIGFGAALAEVFSALPVVQRFSETYALESEPVLDHTLDALLSVYRAWGGTASPPNLAIVDWSSTPTYVEFELCRDAFVAKGVPARIVDPTELEYSGGRLRAGDFEIDLVYRRLVIMDVASKLGLDHPLVAAARDRAACIASGFGGFVVHSKAMFALVSEAAADPDSRAKLSAAERQAVGATMPWTRVVREGRTSDWEGKPISLLEFALENREHLVVKPATDYGGAGVGLGWTLDEGEWATALRGALERPSVLQRRVALPTERFPTVIDGKIELAEYLADIDPYVFNGKAHKGAGTRLSRSQLLNVTAGAGSAAPVFVVEKKC